MQPSNMRNASMQPTLPSSRRRPSGWVKMKSGRWGRSSHTIEDKNQLSGSFASESKTSDLKKIPVQSQWTKRSRRRVSDWLESKLSAFDNEPTPPVTTTRKSTHSHTDSDEATVITTSTQSATTVTNSIIEYSESRETSPQRTQVTSNFKPTRTRRVSSWIELRKAMFEKKPIESITVAKESIKSHEAPTEETSADTMSHPAPGARHSLVCQLGERKPSLEEHSRQRLCLSRNSLNHQYSVKKEEPENRSLQQATCTRKIMVSQRKTAPEERKSLQPITTIRKSVSGWTQIKKTNFHTSYTHVTAASKTASMPEQDKQPSHRPRLLHKCSSRRAHVRKIVGQHDPVAVDSHLGELLRKARHPLSVMNNEFAIWNVSVLGRYEAFVDQSKMEAARTADSKLHFDCKQLVATLIETTKEIESNIIPWRSDNKINVRSVVPVNKYEIVSKLEKELTQVSDAIHEYTPMHQSMEWQAMGFSRYEMGAVWLRNYFETFVWLVQATDMILILLNISDDFTKSTPWGRILLRAFDSFLMEVEDLKSTLKDMLLLDAMLQMQKMTGHPVKAAFWTMDRLGNNKNKNNRSSFCSEEAQERQHLEHSPTCVSEILDTSKLPTSLCVQELQNIN